MEDWVEFPFNRGRLDFLKGLPQPPLPPEDGNIIKPEHARWYGWMVQRAMTLLRADRVRDYIEKGEDLDLPLEYKGPNK